MRRVLLTCAVAALLAPGIAKAEVLSFTQTVVADFEFSLLGNTILNPGPTIDFIPFQAIGQLTFTLDASLNDPSQPTTVPFTNLTGHLDGVSPPPFLPFVISPNVEFLGGELTNIVRDGNGDVISADIKDLSARWDMVTPSMRLYTKVGLPFSAHITSLPFNYGAILAGPAPFEVYLDMGGTAPDPLVVMGRNRTLRVVPEPGSLALFGLGALGVLGLARRGRVARNV